MMQKGKQEDSTQPFRSRNNTLDEIAEIVKEKIQDQQFILSDWQRPVDLGPFYKKLSIAYENEVKNWIISTHTRALKSNERSIDFTKLQNELSRLPYHHIKMEFSEITDTLKFLKVCQYLMGNFPRYKGFKVLELSYSSWLNMILSLYLNEMKMLQHRVELFLKHRARELKKQNKKKQSEEILWILKGIKVAFSKIAKIRDSHVHEKRCIYSAIAYLEALEGVKEDINTVEIQREYKIAFKNAKRELQLFCGIGNFSVQEMLSLAFMPLHKYFFK